MSAEAEARRSIYIYMLYEHGTGLKYVGQTESHPVVRFVKHCTIYKMKLVAQRLRNVGPRSFSVYQIGRAYSKEAANKAEAYFMHHFNTLNFNGLNLECKHAPELLSDFELDMEEFEDVDMTEALEFVEARSGSSVTKRDIEEFEMKTKYGRRRGCGEGGVPERSDGRVLTAEECEAICANFNPFGETMIERLMSQGMSAR
jgi:hypothetical protein